MTLEKLKILLLLHNDDSKIYFMHNSFLDDYCKLILNEITWR